MISTNVSNNPSTDNSQSIENTKDIKISNQIVIGGKVDTNADIVDLLKYCSIERLKTDKLEKDSISKLLKNKTLNLSLPDKVIQALLRPKDWINKPADEEDSNFILDIDTVMALIYQCTKIVQEQPMVLRVEAPVKVFGDIHGQYQDLMRFFDLFSSPITGPGGDIDGLDYVFLGD